MIDSKIRCRRAEQLRGWYYNLDSSMRRSQMKRQIVDELKTSEDCFYQLLRGRTYINDWKRAAIVKVVGYDMFS